jgi:hypothetical protein
MSFLANKTIVGKQSKPFFAVLYGAGGVGKSTLCSAAQSPYFLDIEGGIFHIDAPKSGEVISSPEVLLDYMQALINEKHDYKTIIVDSLSALELLLVQSVFKKFTRDNGTKVKSIEDFGYGRGYVHLLSVWQGFVGMLKKMNMVGLNVILIGHQKIASFESSSGTSYKYYTVNLYDADKNSVLRLVTEQADFVGFMSFESSPPESQGANQSPSPYTGKQPKFKPKKFAPKITQPRVLHTEGTMAFYAKSRFDLESQYPVEDWDWNFLSVQAAGLEAPPVQDFPNGK